MIDIISVISPILQRELPELLGIYLFGSYASLQQNSQSDVDVAVLCETTVPSTKLMDIQFQLALALKKEVDLVDMKRVSTVFLFEIISKGSRIFCSYEEKCLAFEGFVLSSYYRLEEERKLIIQDYLQKGVRHDR